MVRNGFRHHPQSELEKQTLMGAGVGGGSPNKALFSRYPAPAAPAAPARKEKDWKVIPDPIDDR